MHAWVIRNLAETAGGRDAPGVRPTNRPGSTGRDEAGFVAIQRSQRAARPLMTLGYRVVRPRRAGAGAAAAQIDTTAGSHARAWTRAPGALR